MGEAQQPGDGGDTGKPGKPLDVAAQRLVYTKGETVEERVTSAVWSTSPHLPSRSTPLQHLKGAVVTLGCQTQQPKALVLSANQHATESETHHRATH